MTDWRPTAGHDKLLARARLLNQIRNYFSRQQVLEVETPLLGPASVTDPYIESLAVRAATTPDLLGYLHTSPEYAMKRLLASGSGSIYQIARVFRAEESGQWHSREFSMLEWYRVGWTYTQLMDEIQVMLQELCAEFSLPANFTRISYRELFNQAVACDPIHASVDDLRMLVKKLKLPVDVDDQSWDKNQLLDLLMSHSVVNWLQGRQFVFVYDYPASQAALARVRNQPEPVAERFELFAYGVELANGFQELTDAVEQRQRFAQDNRLRQLQNKITMPVDEALLSALVAGLPECAGVALGLDRLLAVLTNSNNLQEVISFYYS